MRVLWICGHGGNYKKSNRNGSGGWVGALQNELMERIPDLELGVAFPHPSDSEMVKQGRLTYLPVCIGGSTSRISKVLVGAIRITKAEEKKLVALLKSRIDEFKPDVVHVWGIENDVAGVIPFIDRPFVVHIQGFMSQIVDCMLPPGFSKHDLHKADFPLRWLLNSGSYRDFEKMEYRAEREKNVARYVKNWIGRTEWDHAISHLLSYNSHYYYCDELMRSAFTGKRWNYHFEDGIVHIHSSLSAEWYKGIDIVLQTAKVLSDYDILVEWNLYGVSAEDYRFKYISRKMNIKPEDLNVKFRGVVGGDTICESLLNCDVFVHPSYIENSSNAIAEAMMLGVPTIAQYVGGNPSMLRDESGILVPANDPYMMADAIVQMTDEKVAKAYSERALAVAQSRNNAEKTVETLMAIYKDVI